MEMEKHGLKMFGTKDEIDQYKMLFENIRLKNCSLDVKIGKINEMMQSGCGFHDQIHHNSKDAITGDAHQLLGYSKNQAIEIFKLRKKLIDAIMDVDTGHYDLQKLLVNYENGCEDTYKKAKKRMTITYNPIAIENK